MIRAAIAIGSNSTRLLVCDLTGPAPLPLLRLREDTKLFMGLSAEGVLDDQAMERTARAVSVLKANAAAAGCKDKDIDLYATSATRDALNRDAFARLLRDRTGLALYTMTGEEEAALAFAAVADGSETLAVDIGGGSTEMTLGRDRVEASVSLQIGASRLLKVHPIKNARDVLPLTEDLRRLIRDRAAPLLARCRAPRPVLLGGTCTAAHDMLAVCPSAERRPDALRTMALAQSLADMPVEQRRLVPGLPSAKAEHIVHGLCILTAVLTETRSENVTVSSKTNLDGWMARLYMNIAQGGNAREE